MYQSPFENLAYAQDAAVQRGDLGAVDRSFQTQGQSFGNNGLRNYGADIQSRILEAIDMPTSTFGQMAHKRSVLAGLGLASKHSNNYLNANSNALKVQSELDEANGRKRFLNEAYKSLLPRDQPVNPADLSRQQGLRRGTSMVVDKTGKGSPKKDTVPAVLAEGEAVLNAGAAELLGRETIEELNERGQERLGLRGSPYMKDGALHAKQGFVDLPGMEGRFVDGAAAEAMKRKYFSDVAATPTKAPAQAFTEKEVLKNMLRRPSIESLVAEAPSAAAATPTKADLFSKAGRFVEQQGGFGGATKAVGKKALGVAVRAAIPLLATNDAIGDGFEYVPNEGESPLSSTAKHTALKVGDIGTRGLDMLTTEPINWVSRKQVIQPFNDIYKQRFIDAGIAQQGQQDKSITLAELQAGREANAKSAKEPNPQPWSINPNAKQINADLITDPRIKAGVQAKQADQAMQISNDQAFKSMGLSPEQRASAKAYNTGEYKGQGLGRLRTDVPGQEIYRKGNAYYGVGQQPSSQNPEEDMRRGLMMAALGGNGEAASILNSMMNNEAHLQAARIAAGARAGKDADKLNVNERIKMGDLLRGEGRGVENMMDVEQRKRDLKAKFQETKDPVKQAQIADQYEALNQDTGAMSTEQLNQVKNIFQNENMARRGLKYGVYGSLPGLAMTGLSFIPQLRWLRPWGLTGTALGGGTGATYGAKTGTTGVNEMTALDDLNPALQELSEDGGNLIGNGVQAPLDLLPINLRRLYMSQ